ncbi:MAG TPA: MarR family transcriptional regulator [Bacteroidetes bacterium]|nr:MarR family transcriptional regulator [Bacteroidota bacterium]
MKIEEEIKGHFRNVYHKGVINLIYTVNQLNYQFEKDLKQHGLTPQQYNVLRVLQGFRSQCPVSIGFIKERMLEKSSDVSRLVDKLYRKGLVERKENKKNRRQKEVDITKKGVELLLAIKNCERKMDTLLLNLNEEEVNQLNRLLDKIRD